jgi:beta-glucanase (GH16 family)
VGAGADVRGARALAVACALLLVASLVAAATRPTVADEAATRVETTPTTRPRPDATTTTSPVTGLDTVPLPDPAITAPATGRAPRSTSTAPSTTEAPTTTAAPAATTPPPDSGRCASFPKAGGGQWQCTLSQEFNGTALDTSVWSVQTTATSGFHSGTECFMDDPDNVSVSAGTLKLTAQREANWFSCAKPRNPYTTRWSSGMVMTYGKWSQTYGRFEIRAKMPTGKSRGLQTALWMWPVDPFKHGPWPASGEIDIAEWYSNRPGYVVPYIHYLAGEAQGATETGCAVDRVEDWHTYALEWSPQTLTILYDGVRCLSITPPLHPFHQPFTIALTQALGVKNNVFDAATTPIPATTEIDYVRAWR